MSKKNALIVMAAAAVALTPPAFACCGAYLSGRGLIPLFWLLLAAFGAVLAALAFFLRRWVMLPMREARAALEAIESPDTSLRLPENAGVFTPFSQKVNRLLDECERRQRQIDCANQRYRLMARLSDDVTFEFDLESDAIRDSTDWDRIASGKAFLQGTVSREIVHPEDAEKFVQFFRGNTVAGEFRDVDLRLRTHPDADYQWTQIRGVTLGDEDGRPAKILGRRFNIEKFQREKLHLQKQAQHDLLTGLYNKSTAEELVRKILENGAGEQCALLIVDIDDFKGVNDTLGHLAGDEVLRESAAGISALFRKDDIIGRIGGDEFLVLFTSSSGVSREMLRTRCGQIQGVFRSLPACGRYGTSFTCSIGVACCPLDGASFSILYQNADRALYMAKGKGRNQFAFFSRSLDCPGQAEKDCGINPAQ